tara:strand:- start:76 stop:246 length:171 start_codon:yes stop_codon:yes gene_type:complete
MTSDNRTSDVQMARNFAETLGNYGEITITRQTTEHCGSSVTIWVQEYVRDALVEMS